MRIALFTTSFPSNGETSVNAGACVKDFAEALADLGHKVEVLTPYKRGARHEFRHANTIWFGWLGNQDSLIHIGRSPIGLLQLGSVVVMGSVAALRLSRRFRPDHVLCFWVFPCGLWARLAQLWVRAPYSVWALGSDIWVLRKLPCFPRILRWLARGATHRYADGVALGQDFQAIAGCRVDFLATSRVLTVPPGVAVGEGGYYLFLGRYHENKGIDLLIEAVGKVKEHLPADFRLRAHGFGPLEEAIRARVRDLGLDSVGRNSWSDRRRRGQHRASAGPRPHHTFPGREHSVGAQRRTSNAASRNGNRRRRHGNAGSSPRGGDGLPPRRRRHSKDFGALREDVSARRRRSFA